MDTLAYTVDSHTCVYVFGAFILGYSVQWEEESTVVTCTHTLFEATTNSEVYIAVGDVAIEVTFWEVLYLVQYTL